MTRRVKILFPIFLVQFLFHNCSDRSETPRIYNDSTIVYPSKSEYGIDATITFCEKISKKTGKLLKAGTVFSIKENEKVTAVIKLINRDYHRDQELMFHVDWLDSNYNSLFKKRINLYKNDSTAMLTSALGISPDKRLPGKYSLRFYLFRELIAEKQFKLVKQAIDSSGLKQEEAIDNLSAEITLCRGISKETGEPIGAGNSFTMKKKSKIVAIIKLKEINSTERPPVLLAEWMDPDGKIFFKKKIEISPGSSFYTSSVSTSPDKRKPGSHSLKIYYSGKLIAGKKFELLKDIKKNTTREKKSADVSAEIILCKKTDRITGEPVGIDSVFKIKDKSNLTALVKLVKNNSGGSDLMKFFIDWIGPDDSSFYRKKIVLAGEDTSSVISSSISVSGIKRKPGNYLVRLYLSKKLLAEKKFILINEEP
jgi:hypothetical protein